MNKLIKEDTMATEIKRNSWSRFCKKFNVTNQYRQSTMSVKRRNKSDVVINQGSPFMGVTITKKGRLIEGIELLTCQNDPEKLTEPIVTVKQPVKVALEKDASGKDNRLSIEGKDGTVADVVLSGEKDPQQYHSFVEKVAYSICERRGFTSGSDLDDWVEAERKIKEAELQLIR